MTTAIRTSILNRGRHGFVKNAPCCDDCGAPISVKPRHGLCLPCAQSRPDRPDRNS